MILQIIKLDPRDYMTCSDIFFAVVMDAKVRRIEVVLGKKKLKIKMRKKSILPECNTVTCYIVENNNNKTS